MFRILIIQAQNTLSDDRAEFLISDRLSFMRFPGTGLQDKVPEARTIRAFPERLTPARAIDAPFARFETALRTRLIRIGARAPDETTIRRFREALARTGAVEKLFARFDAHLKDAGYPAMGGQIVDAAIVAAPRRRMMTNAGKEIVKGGGIPPDWQANPRKPAQKDRDARWTLKRGRRKTRPDGTAMVAIKGSGPRHSYLLRNTADAAHPAMNATNTATMP